MEIKLKSLKCRFPCGGVCGKRSEWEKTLEHKRLPDILHRTFSVGSETGIVKFNFKSSKFLHSAFNNILKFSGCYSIGFDQNQASIKSHVRLL